MWKSAFRIILFWGVAISIMSCNWGSAREDDKALAPISAYFPKERISEERLTAYNDLFQPILDKSGLNGSVLVALNGYIIYEYNGGHSNFGTRKTIDDSTLFQIASISKIFTAAAIMKLEEEGKLSIDDTVSKHLEDIIYKNITIRELLSHRTGIPRYEYYSNQFWDSLDSDYIDAVYNKLNQDSSPLYFRPNSRFLYSNTGYVVLAKLIEKLAEESFETYIRRELFEPAEMYNSFFITELDSIEGYNIAKGYHSKRRKSPLMWQMNSLDMVLGDKSIYTNTKDLLSWYRAISLGRILSEESLEKIMDINTFSTNQNRGYGLGIRWKKVDDREFFYHNGRWNGFRSVFAYRPDTKLLVIALSNTSESAVRISNSIIDAYDEKASPKPPIQGK